MDKWECTHTRTHSKTHLPYSLTHARARTHTVHSNQHDILSWIWCDELGEECEKSGNSAKFDYHQNSKVAFWLGTLVLNFLAYDCRWTMLYFRCLHIGPVITVAFALARLQRINSLCAL